MASAMITITSTTAKNNGHLLQPHRHGVDKESSETLYVHRHSIHPHTQALSLSIRCLQNHKDYTGESLKNKKISARKLPYPNH